MLGPRSAVFLRNVVCIIDICRSELGFLLMSIAPPLEAVL